MEAALSPPTPPVNRWTAAARVRRSRRSFAPEPVAGDAAEALARHCAAPAAFPGARVVLLREAPQPIFTGWLLGVYGKVVAPSALVFVADRRSPGAAARAGYAGEAAVLEATALGFSTCWIGGGVRRGVVAELLGLASHEHVYSISALGHAPAHKGLGERATAGIARAHSRKPPERLAPGSASWPLWAREGVELARIAPSATNRQPWRFAYEPGEAGGPSATGADARVHGSGTGGTDDPGSADATDSVRVYFEGADTPVISKRLDCGIAMLHFELAARAAGADGRWELLEGRDVARWRLSAAGPVSAPPAPR